MAGTETTNLPVATDVDDLLGNYEGSTVRVALRRLAALVSTVLGPSYQTRAELFDDLAWPDGASGTVWGGSTEAYKGVYRKSGASGAGSWSRVGDLPVNSLTEAQLAAKADATDLAAASDRLGKIYVSRDDAVAKLTAAPLPVTILRIVTIEGDALVVRGRLVSTDDPLFDSSPQWGVVSRLDVAAERSHRIAAIRDAGVMALVSVAGTPDAITASLTPSMIAGGATLSGVSTVELIPVAANTGPVTLDLGEGPVSVRAGDGAEMVAGTLVAGRSYWLRRRGAVWRVVAGGVTATEMAAEATARVNATRDTGVLPLTSIGGTADAITAIINPAVGVPVSGLSTVELIPAATNTGEVTLAVGADPARPVCHADGAPLAAGALLAGRSYLLRQRATQWRIISGDATAADLARKANVTDLAMEAALRTAAVEAVATVLAEVNAEIDRPFEAIVNDGTHWIDFDAGRRAIGGFDRTGWVGILSDRTIANFGPRFLAMPNLSMVIETVQGQFARVLDWDEGGRAMLLWRPGPDGGYDGHFAQEFWDRGREKLNLANVVDEQYVTLSICLSQSLLFMGGDSDVAPLYPDVDTDTALMIGGLRRADGIAAGLPGPRSMTYDYTTPGTGFVSVDPAGRDPSGAYYAVKGYNGWRKKYGLIRRRNVGMLWGQPGEHITRFNGVLGDTPGNLTDSIHHWDNLMYWMDEAARLAAAGDLIPRVDLLVTQGTSSKADADPMLHARTLRQLIVDLRREFDQRGFEDATVYFTQPGGDADTTGSGTEHWQVTQSYLDLAEDGYGVLVTPEAPIRIWDNNVHFGEIAGEALLGQYNWARAAREAGLSWTIRKPVVTRSGLMVTLDYASLWDGEMWEAEPDRYAGQGINQYLGYTCQGATITGMEMVGRKIRLTFDAVPLRIDYMMQSQNVIPLNDGYTAFRGLLATTTRMRDPLNSAVVHRRRMPSHRVAVPQ